MSWRLRMWGRKEYRDVSPGSGDVRTEETVWAPWKSRKPLQHLEPKPRGHFHSSSEPTVLATPSPFRPVPCHQQPPTPITGDNEPRRATAASQRGPQAHSRQLEPLNSAFWPECDSSASRSPEIPPGASRNLLLKNDSHWGKMTCAVTSKTQSRVRCIFSFNTKLPRRERNWNFRVRFDAFWET